MGQYLFSVNFAYFCFCYFCSEDAIKTLLVKSTISLGTWRNDIRGWIPFAAPVKYILAPLSFGFPLYSISNQLESFRGNFGEIGRRQELLRCTESSSNCDVSGVAGRGFIEFVGQPAVAARAVRRRRSRTGGELPQGGPHASAPPPPSTLACCLRSTRGFP